MSHVVNSAVRLGALKNLKNVHLHGWGRIKIQKNMNTLRRNQSHLLV